MEPLGSALTVVALVGLVASSLPGFIGASGGREIASQATDGSHDGTAIPPATAPGASSATVVEGGPASPKVGSTGALRSAVAPSLDATPAPPGDAGGGVPSGVFLASVILLPIGLLLVLGRGVARRLIGAAREP